MMSYTCPKEMLPMVEAALATHGYTLESLFCPRGSGIMMVMMSDRDCNVLLSHNKPDELAQIEVWGAAQAAASDLLETLPLALRKQPPVASGMC
ncbi:MAG: hypothetical protein MUD01_28925 [Chloroflexaceae bacterium]|jgi:hypothetical protein|nr:hypothetical protein [Chloroflexaceae bacterium]